MEILMSKFNIFLTEKTKSIQEEKDKESLLKHKIITFMNTKEVSEDNLERFAKDNGIGITNLYLKIAEMFNEFLYRDDEKEVDRDQLEKGIKHEYEHTKDRDIAKIIALDHIKQISDYYDKLETFDKD